MRAEVTQAWGWGWGWCWGWGTGRAARAGRDLAWRQAWGSAQW